MPYDRQKRFFHRILPLDRLPGGLMSDGLVAKRFRKVLRRYHVFGLALIWLVVITVAHEVINSEKESRRIVKMGYMPVVTNLAAPLLDKASRNFGDIFFQAVKFSSFSEMGEALRNDSIDVAFMIAPLSIVLRQQGVDVKVVYIGNRHESTLVIKKQLAAKNIRDLQGRSIAVPLRYSGHNITLKRLMKQHHLEGQINIVEMNPPDMPAALMSGSLDGYFVGEPFASSTLMNSDSKVFFHVEDVEKRFICNLMLVKNDFIKNEPESVRKLVQGAVRSGLWAEKNIDKAAAIAAEHDYWNQPVELIRYALTEKQNRTLFDRYEPKEAEMQKIATGMMNFGMLRSDNIDGLVYNRFAKEAKTDRIGDLESILR